MNTSMFCWIINVWGIWWIESKLKIVKQEPMKPIKFLNHPWIIKYIS